MHNLITLLRKSRNAKNLISRAITILQRFSFSPEKLENVLIQYIELLRKFKLSPTFPVTAIILERYPETIKALQNKGANLAVHGYSHIDYLIPPLSEIQEHLNKAKKIFSEYNISFIGFRAPYTRWSNLQILKDSNFEWDSSQTILWDVLDSQVGVCYTPLQERSYLQAIKLYTPLDAKDSLSLPSFPLTTPDFVEIPLSLPDDEMLIDRLKLPEEEINRIWLKILNETYKDGELFTLQVHHERFLFCSSIIELLLRTASNLPIWLANLEEIAQWWQEKATFSAEFDNKNTIATIKFNCSPRATILLRNITTIVKTEKWDRNYNTIWAIHELPIQTEILPIIGIKNCSPEFISFLKQEGYILEEAKGNNYAFYFENMTETDFNKWEYISEIEESDRPLIRFWRWPYNKRSAFSITGDIDAFTLFDFFARMLGR